MKRGALAHKLVDEACTWYKARGRALVSFAGPEWIDVRPVKGARGGRFSGIQKRGPVDYVGHDSSGRGFRFDLKASAEKVSLKLDDTHVPPHQKEELAWCAKCGVPAGLLVARFNDRQQLRGWYWLPAAMLVDREWARVKWANMEELGCRIGGLDVAQRVPDFLDAILSA